MMGSGMGYTNGYNNGMGGDCCPMKKIWGSMNPKMDGMYVNVGKKSWGQLPGRCNSQCVYERKGAYDGLQYCFGDSMYSQSECDATASVCMRGRGPMMGCSTALETPC